jgi:hypothetical protein
MTRLLALLAALLPLSLSAVWITNLPPVVNVKIAFDFPTNRLNTNGWFNFYHSTNFVLPLSSWGQLTSFYATTTVYTVSIVPGEHYFYLTYSNFWSEWVPQVATNVSFPMQTLPSEVFWTPPMPVGPTNTTISK